MKKKSLLIASAIVIVLMMVALLSACSQQEAETESEQQVNETQEKVTESDKRGLGSVADVEYQTYADVLKINEEAIRASESDWQRDVDGNEFQNNVLLYDLNVDGDPELLLMLGSNEGGVLHIFTMKDGKAVECEYDVSKALYARDNDAPFKFIVAGGGSDYMIYSGKEKGTFYAAYNIWDTNLSSSSTKYSMNDEGLVKAETIVSNVVNRDPYSDSRDDYYIDDKAVSADEGASVFKEHREDYKELLMYNMKYGSVKLHEDFKVFEKLNTDKPLGGSYDEVLEQLSVQ